MSTTTEIVGTTLRTVHLDGGGNVTAVSYDKITEAELLAIVSASFSFNDIALTGNTSAQDLAVSGAIITEDFQVNNNFVFGMGSNVAFGTSAEQAQFRDALYVADRTFSILASVGG